VTAERDWDSVFDELIAEIRATTAMCRHCLEQIHLIPGMSNCGQPVWEDENGFPACVKGTVRYRGQREFQGGKFADLDITPPVLHEPMPAGLDGAPA
jgi:hypothetical protein